MNIVNNRFVTVPDTTVQTSAGFPDASKTADAHQTATAPDNLMSQLMEDTEATNLRPNSAIIEQALKEASLPVTENNTAIVTALLENSMPIGRDSIRMTLAQLKAYPELPLEALLNMNKAGIAVNAESVTTMHDFLSNVSVLTENLNDLADMLESVLSDPATSPEFSQSIQDAIYETITAADNSATASNAAVSNAAGTPAGQASALSAGPVTTETAAAAQTVITGTPGSVTAESSALPNSAIVQTAETALSANSQTHTGDSAPDSLISDNLSDSGAGSNEALSSQTANPDISAASPTAVDGAAAEGSTPPGTAAGAEVSGDIAGQSSFSAEAASQKSSADILPGEIPEAASNSDLSGHNDYSFRSFEELTNPISSGEAQATHMASDANALASSPAALEAARDNHMSELSKNIRNLSARELKNLLKSALSLSPEKLSKAGIRDLYERSQNFINKIKDAASHDEVHAKLFAKASQAMQNLDMLNNLNHIYPHIELPLKLQNDKADGGLYVYANRKNRVSSDAVTALLHLNLPHLGLVDIHLSLKDRYLGMNFYTNDEAGSLLEGDIASLREKLEGMDYSVFTHFNPQENEAKDLRSMMSSSGAGISSSVSHERLSFDIRT